MKNVAQMPRWWGTIREQFSPLLICLILALPAMLLLGAAIGAFSPVYGVAAAGALVMVIIVLLRLNALTVTLIIAAHLYIDWYLGLHLVAILMALVLLFAYYFGRSADHPWVEPRPLWLWALFLVLTIYPAIYGGQLLLYDLASFYPSAILGAFLMFWLGSIIAKNVSVLQRVFQLLFIVAALLAIHTIIQATTGVFLFLSASADTYLVHVSNYEIIGTNASRAGSLFLDPNWN